jgi:hypothetical protein
MVSDYLTKPLQGSLLTMKSMFDQRKSPEPNPSFIYGFVYIHINAFGIDANIGVCWKSSMIGFRSFLIEGVDRVDRVNQHLVWDTVYLKPSFKV